MTTGKVLLDHLEAEFTIAICTLNRCAYLQRAVREALAQLEAFPQGSLLIVDNGSTDDTFEYASALAQTNSRVRLLIERRTGLYYGRAAAIDQARGDVLIFLDDDAVPQEGWLKTLLQEMKSAPTIGVVGCAIDGLWETARPAWLADRLLREIPVMSPPRGRIESFFPCYPPGISLAIRLNECAKLYAQQARRCGYPLGRNGTPADGVGYRLLGGEDTDLCEIYARNGFRVVWIAAGRVSHSVARERMEPSWYLQKFRSEGHLRIRLLRLAGYPVISQHSWKMLAALPFFALARPLVRLLPKGRAVLVQAYYSKCAGAWIELLGGPRPKPLPYVLNAPAQTESRLEAGRLPGQERPSRQAG